MAYNKKILIIEDDPDISMIEEAYLQASGFETKILSPGAGQQLINSDFPLRFIVTEQASEKIDIFIHR